jgi:uncharacterized Zn finger protein (UPF0148 family)
MTAAYEPGSSRATNREKSAETARQKEAARPRHLCDRCGTEMYEQNCKVICPNCGNRFDCSDLTVYMD